MESQDYELEEGEIIDDAEITEPVHQCKHKVKTILKDKKNKHSSKVPKNFLHDKCDTCYEFVKYKVTKKCPYHKISSHHIKHKIREKKKHSLQKMCFKKSLHKIQNYNKLLNQNPIDLKIKASNNESEISSTSTKDENSKNTCKKFRYSNENIYKLTQNNCKCVKESNASLKNDCDSSEAKFKAKVKSSLINQNGGKDKMHSQIDGLDPKININNSSNHICIQNDVNQINENKEKEDIAPDSTTKQSDPDSEDDEEELRRKALASCSQRTNNSNCELATSLINEHFIDSCSSENTFIHDQTSDDYHVIDMDVDQDYRDVPIEIENMEQNDMFVIDSSPFSPLENDDKNEIISIQNKPNPSFNQDDEFEETLLRAQLILSMQKKQNQKEDKNEKFENNTLKNSSHNQNLEKNIPKNNKNSLSNNDALETVPLEKKIIIDKEMEKIKLRKPPERIVITLTDDSSDDSEIDNEIEDSEPENKNNKIDVGSNASIDQLITNARKKSDEINMDRKNNVPLALSCLSKAQQEEYNKLKKILAQKQSFQLKNKRFFSQELNEKKLKQAKLALQKEIKRMSLLKHEVNKKRLVHNESKLVLERSKQHFVQAKEQLNSSQKAEKTNEQLYLKSLTQFHQSQKEINRLQKMVIDLQMKCSKQNSPNDNKL